MELWKEKDSKYLFRDFGFFSAAKSISTKLNNDTDSSDLLNLAPVKSKSDINDE